MSGSSHTLRSSPDTPLWSQVLEDLRERIGQGEFLDRFPTDRELVDTYEVSRHTIREAVRRLQMEGVVDRHRGRGSTVVQAPFEQPLGTLYSLFRSIEATGSEQTSRVLVRERRSDPGAAQVLECDVGAALFYLERVRLVDGVPIAHDRAWIPFEVASPLMDVDFRRTALYDELRTNCGAIPERGSEWIRPIVPDGTESRLLQMAAGTPAFEVARRTEWRGRPLEWRVTVIRGDRYVMRANWSGGSADGLAVIAER